MWAIKRRFVWSRTLACDVCYTMRLFSLTKRQTHSMWFGVLSGTWGKTARAECSTCWSNWQWNTQVLASTLWAGRRWSSVIASSSTKLARTGSYNLNVVITWLCKKASGLYLVKAHVELISSFTIKRVQFCTFLKLRYIHFFLYLLKLSESVQQCLKCLKNTMSKMNVLLESSKASILLCSSAEREHWNGSEWIRKYIWWWIILNKVVIVVLMEVFVDLKVTQVNMGSAHWCCL